ncbi:MAG TPA: TIGR03435 family protein [Edaphobacter sp.]|uniref:TIGR03435 family protein n=1 Tax=Edaphobacter sp. TaxID=1934404 RepID=UPI002D0ACB78|nr:TIGR03435 family protein [Edaphobacter sp.]HUZ94902.1 TIGR03435 family protein [Edaphobacter sp.]
MSNLQSQLYGAMIRLHPADFRNEFGREMTLDFEDALTSNGFARLYLDALLSLARQWAAYAFPQTTETPITQQSLLSGHYVMVSQGCLTFFDLARASILSAIFLLAIGFALTTSSSRITISLQASHEAQHKGITVAEANGQFPLSLQQTNVANHLASAPSWQTHSTRRGVPGRNLNGVETLRHDKRTGDTPSPELPNPLWRLAALIAFVSLATWLLHRNPHTGKKIIFTTLGFLTIAMPSAFGIMRMVPVHAQILHASGPVPSFEVATIRPWEPPPMPIGQPLPMKVSPGRLRGQVSDRVHFVGEAAILIASAYNLQLGHENHIVGAPAWVQQQSNRYEIQAKIEDSLYAAMQKMTPMQQREQVEFMEQSLLANRFKLKVHFETREMPIYALVVAKGGPKLSPAKEGESTRLFDTAESEHGIETTATAITLDDFARSPLVFGGRTVVDQTGLKGAYDFTLKWGREQPADSDTRQQNGADAPYLFTAIQEQLGLKLVPTKGPVEVIVIDHIEKPSAN